jgi:predicted amidophosphoribosyltransferase
LTPAEQEIRRIAYAIKDPANVPDMDRAAAPMARLVDGPPELILVPVPSSTGNTEANAALARAIIRRLQVSRARIVKAIRRTAPVQSSCTRRRAGLHGLKPADHHFERAGAMLPILTPVYLVDNVTTTGATMEAALRVIPWADALVYADAKPNRP